MGKSPSALSQPSAFHNSSLRNISSQEDSYTQEQTQKRQNEASAFRKLKERRLFQVW